MVWGDTEVAEYGEVVAVAENVYGRVLDTYTNEYETTALLYTAHTKPTATPRHSPARRVRTLP